MALVLILFRAGIVERGTTTAHGGLFREDVVVWVEHIL